MDCIHTFIQIIRMDCIHAFDIKVMRTDCTACIWYPSDANELDPCIWYQSNADGLDPCIYPSYADGLHPCIRYHWVRPEKFDITKAADLEKQASKKEETCCTPDSSLAWRRWLWRLRRPWRPLAVTPAGPTDRKIAYQLVQTWLDKYWDGVSLPRLPAFSRPPLRPPTPTLTLCSSHDEIRRNFRAPNVRLNVAVTKKFAVHAYRAVRNRDLIADSLLRVDLILYKSANFLFRRINFNIPSRGSMQRYQSTSERAQRPRYRYNVAWRTQCCPLPTLLNFTPHLIMFARIVAQKWCNKCRPL